MPIKVSVQGAAQTANSIGKIPQDLKRGMVEAMNISLRDVQEEARREHRFTTRTGEAERSIESSGAKISGTTVSGEVGTTRQITVYLHEGTKPHMIVPRSKRVLRWATGSQFAFARRVHHPGTKADPFIYDALANNEAAIVRRFDDVIARLR